MSFADRFADRADAGRQLAERLVALGYGERGRPGLLVLALPRGGVPVAFEVARALHAPLDVFLVRKLGVPGHEELAMGAIASGGVRVVNHEVASMLEIPEAVIEQATRDEQEELERRERQYRHSRPVTDVGGRTVIVIDDGLATGSTMRAAVAALRQQHPAKIVVAVPVGARDSCELLRAEADEVVCLMMPEFFQAVGQWYGDFPQTSDQEVGELLRRAAVPAGIPDGPNQMGASRE